METKVIDGDFFESFKNESNVLYAETHRVMSLYGKTCDVLITHNSDWNITERLYQEVKSKIKFEKWFAQNIACKHDDLFCLPIGLERKRWANFDKEDAINNAKLNFKLAPDEMVYGNFSLVTNFSKRLVCFNAFQSKPYFVKHIWKETPKVSVLTQSQYLWFCNEILKHKFCLCPEGNGIDTHRLWEVFYLGRYPVVLHNEVNDSFSDLPILILDRWDEFEAKKDSFLKRIESEKKFSTEKLTREYWKRKILASEQ